MRTTLTDRPAERVAPEHRPRKLKREKRPGLYLLDPQFFGPIYGPEQQQAIAELVDITAPPQTSVSIQQQRKLLADVEVIFSGWGAPVMDEQFLAAAPQLQIVFYGAGSIRGFTTAALWRRGVRMTSAYGANAVPVAEYTLATILLSLKHFWRQAALAKSGGAWWPRTGTVPGGYRSTVGLISLGAVARHTLHLLNAFDLHRIVFAPDLTVETAACLRVERGSLEEVFRRGDVVSLHTPNLPETRGMITGAHFASMKQGATFINTARGAVVREQELIEVLRRRPDLTVVLDVTDPEPPPADSPLLALPNVVLTPHIAGAMDGECRRLGQFMVEELRRFVAGEPLHGEITQAQSQFLA